jgi:hypothetical protein
MHYRPMHHPDDCCERFFNSFLILMALIFLSGCFHAGPKPEMGPVPEEPALKTAEECRQVLQDCHACCLDNATLARAKPDWDTQHFTCSYNRTVPVPGECHLCLGGCLEYCWSAYEEMPVSLCSLNINCYNPDRTEPCQTYTPVRLQIGKFSIEPYPLFRYWAEEDGSLAYQNIYTNRTHWSYPKCISHIHIGYFFSKAPENETRGSYSYSCRLNQWKAGYDCQCSFAPYPQFAHEYISYCAAATLLLFLYFIGSIFWAECVNPPRR